MARGTLTVRIIGEPENFQRAMRNAERDADRFAGRVLGSVAAVGAAVGAGLAASVVSFANFDQAMTNSTAIMGNLTDSMRNDMAEAAREVGTTTQFSATEAAEAFFFLASAGLDAAGSIGALPQVAAFAQAGQFDLARATDLLTDAQSALGLSSDDAAENLLNMSRVSDVLVGANTLANASVEQFSEALTERAGSALRQLGKDVEEGVAVLAVFADQGLKGSAAGTQLNSVLEGLTRTARENAQNYADMGVAVFDSNGEMRNMGDIVADLEGALGGMNTEQQLAALSGLGLTRTARDGVVALLGQSDAIRGYEADLRSAGGVTQDISDNQMQTFWAQLGLLKDQFLDVAISIGERLMPHIEAFIALVDENQEAIVAFIEDAVDALITAFVDYLIPAFETLVEWIGTAVDWWNNLSDPIKTAIKYFGIALAAIIPIIAVIIKVIAIVKAFAVVLALVTSPIGLVVAAIALLIAAVVLIVKNWGPIVDWFQDLWDNIVDLWNKAVDWIVGIVEGLVEQVVEWFWELTEFLAEIVAGILTNMIDTWQDIRDRVVGFASGLWDGVRQKFQDMLSFVREIPMRIRQALSNMGTLLMQAGRDLIEGFMRGLRQVIDTPVNAVRGMVTNIRRLMPGSPADEGPLSGRGYTAFSGAALAEDFGAGIADGAAAAVRAARTMQADVSSTLMPVRSFGGSDGAMAAGAGVGPSTEINITVTSADPEAVVEAIRRYTRVNGTIPGVSTRAGL